jgi:hypothetical protein
LLKNSGNLEIHQYNTRGDGPEAAADGGKSRYLEIASFSGEPSSFREDPV